MKLDTYVAARFVRSDGAELLADGTDWLLTPGSVEGVCRPVFDVFTQDNAVSDGAAVTGKRVAVRELTMTASALRVTDNAALRAQAASFFNPKYSYEVYLTYQGRTRWIAAELAGFDAPTERVSVPQTFTVTWLAANPYWQSIDDFGQDIASVTPRWGFPYMDNPACGVLVDVANFAQQVIFNYDGDVPAYPAITITADAEVSNPKIVKDGAFVRLLDRLAAGDTVEISTSPRRIRITKNGQNVLNKVDRASSFAAMQMLPGTNTVSFGADAGDNSMHVVIRYTKQYLGV